MKMMKMMIALLQRVAVASNVCLVKVTLTLKASLKVVETWL